MSVKVYPATPMHCELCVRWHDYPRLVISAEYGICGEYSIGVDICQLEKKVHNAITRFFAQKEAMRIMGGYVKPDLVLPLERRWFAKIWNGEKDTEYRAVKPYWTKWIGEWVGDHTPRFIMFRLGYAKDGPRILVQTSSVDVGPCPYGGEWTGDYYRIRFHVVQWYFVADGVMYPFEEVPRMSEKKGGAK